MISATVYLMCALTSTLCAALLYMNFRRNRTRLLLWSSICFLCLAINNSMLFIDLVLTPQIDMSVVRTLPAVIGFGALVWGFIWDTP
jgi:hypothetical protein